MPYPPMMPPEAPAPIPAHTQTKLDAAVDANPTVMAEQSVPKIAATELPPPTPQWSAPSRNSSRGAAQPSDPTQVQTTPQPLRPPSPKTYSTSALDLGSEPLNVARPPVTPSATATNSTAPTAPATANAPNAEAVSPIAQPLDAVSPAANRQIAEGSSSPTREPATAIAQPTDTTSPAASLSNLETVSAEAESQRTEPTASAQLSSANTSDARAIALTPPAAPAEMPAPSTVADATTPPPRSMVDAITAPEPSFSRSPVADTQSTPSQPFSATPLTEAAVTVPSTTAATAQGAATDEFKTREMGDRPAAATAVRVPFATAEAALAQDSHSEPVVLVENINVQGSSIFSPAELADILEDFTGRELTTAEQQAAADLLTQEYLKRGYLTSRAVLTNPPVDAAGILQIDVIEGAVEAIEITGLERLQENYLRSRIELATGTPLNSIQLEDQLRLLRQNPLIDNIEASLARGEAFGQSIVRVRVSEASPWDAYIGVDNYSPPSVGSTQMNLAVAHQNLTGRGDRLGATYQRTTTGGASTLEFRYAIPVNPMDGTLELRTTFERNEIPFISGLDISGHAEEYGIQFRQPLILTPQEELALSLGFDYRDGQTFLGDRPFGFGQGPDPATGISRTSVIRFGQDYVRRDPQGAWALRSQFNLGTGWFDATTNAGSIPDSRFVSWLGQVQRVQQLNPDHLLIISADAQLTPSSLLPSEKFVIGGAQSVRGYRQNIRGGDNGVRLSIEDRITLQRDEAGLPNLQLAPFVDMGTVWNVADNPNTIVNEQFLVGVGLGMLWEPLPDLDIRVNYGLPLIGASDRGDDLQDQGIYFQIGYRI